LIVVVRGGLFCFKGVGGGYGYLLNR